MTDPTFIDVALERIGRTDRKTAFDNLQNIAERTDHAPTRMLLLALQEHVRAAETAEAFALAHLADKSAAWGDERATPPEAV